MDAFLEVVESDGSSVEAPDSVEVVVAAIEEWSFLASLLDDVEDKTEEAMEVFVEQLESTDVSVQVAAGEAIALLFEKSYTEGEVDDAGHPIATKRYEVYRQHKQLMYTLSQLTRDSSKSISKKDRKTLHTNFADIIQTIEVPTRGPRYSTALNHHGKEFGSRMTVRIHRNGYMRIDRWWKLLRLQALRRLFGGGLLIHYEDNPAVFDVLP